MAIVRTNTNLSAVTYALGEDIIIRNGAILTVDSTPTVFPGNISCTTSGTLFVNNTSNTTPLNLLLQNNTKDFIFSAGGKLQIVGNFIEVGLSAGALFTTSTAAFKDITLVQAERVAGSNEYFALPLVRSDARFFGLGRTLRGTNPSGADFENIHTVAFYDQVAQTLTIGANGSFLPNGCRIRVPNILLGNQDSGNTAATVSHLLLAEGAPTGGTFTITVRRPRTGTVLGTTVALPFNATNAAVDTALETILGAATITPAGGPLPAAITLVQTGVFATEPLEFQINSSLTGGTNAVVYDRDTSSASFTLVQSSSSGEVEAFNACFASNVRFVATQHGPIAFNNVGVSGDGFVITNSVAPLLFSNNHFSSSPFVAAVPHFFGTQLGQQEYLNSVFMGILPSSATLSVSSCQVDAFVGNTIVNYMPRNSAGICSSFNACAFKTPFTDYTCIGGRTNFNLVNNATFINLRLADKSSAGVSTLNAVAALVFTSSSDILVNTVRSIGTSAARNQVFNADANCARFSITDVDYDMRLNSTSGLQYFGVDCEFSAITLRKVSVNTIPVQGVNTFACRTPSANKVTILESPVGPFHNPLGGPSSQFDMVSCGGFNVSYLASAVGLENYVGGNFTFSSLNTTLPTLGCITFGTLHDGTGLEVTGGYADGIGNVILDANQSLTATLGFPMRGVTSFIGTALVTGRFQEGRSLIHTLINDGICTGGTYTVTLKNSEGTVLGTTPPQAFNVTAATLQLALRAIPGANSFLTVSGSLNLGFSINTAVANYLVADGSLLTGGGLPNFIDYFVTFTNAALGDVGPRHVIEFSSKKPTDTTWGAWNTYTPVSLVSTGLPGGYSATEGMNLRLRVTALPTVVTQAFTSVRAVGCLTTVDTSLVPITDASLTVRGLLAGEEVVIKAFDNSTLFSGFAPSNSPFTIKFTLGSTYVNTPTFLERRVGGNLLVSTFTEPFTSRLGFNGIKDLFYGNQLQVATTTVTTGGGGGSVDLTPVLNAVAAVDAKVTNVDGDVALVDTKVTALGTTLATVNTGVTTVNTKVDDIRTLQLSDSAAISTIGNRTFTMNGNINDIEAFLGSNLSVPTSQLFSSAEGAALQANLFTYINSIPNAVLEFPVEPGATLEQSLRLSNAVLGGVTTGAGTGNEKFKSLDGTKDRVIASVNTTSGERTVVTKDLT